MTNHKVTPPPRLIMVTGGQRSGKSLNAEKIVLSLSDKPLYIATAMVLDDEMALRVEKHRSRRGENWETFEAPFNPSLAPVEGRTVLLDCLTMLASNWFFKLNEDVEAAYESVAGEIESLCRSDATTIVVVTNEIGLGGVSGDRITRLFTDLQGRLNSMLAQRSDKVIMCVSSIPVTIKM